MTPWYVVKKMLEDVGSMASWHYVTFFFFALISLIPIGFYMDLHGKSMILQEFTCFYIFYTRNMLRNAPQAEVDDVATTATRAMDDGTGGAEEHRVMEDGEVGDLSTWEDTY
jgi:hypothetical protein